MQLVEDNHSVSVTKRAVRGLHFEIPPFARVKLLRVNRRIDIRCRRRYPLGFFELRAPRHFRTLKPNTEVIYKA